ncbi:MAG: type IV pilus twitching motility protein PilT [Planctomycetota bacterium]
MTNEDQEHLLGDIAVKYGLLTAEQLRLALALQRRETPRRSLGAVLLENQMLAEPVLERLLDAQRRLRGLSESAPGVKAQAVVERLSQRASLAEYLGVLRELGATELQLVPGSPPFVRAHGGLIDLVPRRLELEEVRALLAEAMTTSEAEALERDHSVLFATDLQGGRYRVAAFQHERGLTAILRAIPSEPPDLDSLGLPAGVEAITHLHHGLVLITGPRGSGRSTTLAALIQRMNRGRRRHVVTIEQPITYRFESEHCQISQREVGKDVPTYQAALRSVLREDPDVIVVGELGDPERIATALTAAETGQLVLGTLHSSTATRALLRVLDAYSGRHRALVQGMLASQLRMIVSQRLLPDVDHRRQHLAAEVLINNAAVAAMIREDRLHQIPQVIETSREEGMQLMDEALSALVVSGRVAREEALAWAEDPDRIQRFSEVKS